jgi:F0F1-type ATP synthase assembly protein I
VTDPPGGDTPERRTARRQGIAYQGASEAFVAILITIGIGYWADRHFGTSPLYLLIGAGVGFGAFVLRLFRLGRQIERLRGPGDDPPPPANHPR